MIAVLSGDAVFQELADMNQYGRFQLYRIKSTSCNDIHLELARLSAYSHLIFDISCFPKEESNDLLEPLCNKQAKIIVIASSLSPYDLVVRDFYGMGIMNVITDGGQAMQKAVNDILLADNAQESPSPPDGERAHRTGAPESGSVPPGAPVELTGESAAPGENDRPAAVPRSAGAAAKRACMIAFAGAGPRIGTTTQVFQTALYLRSMYHKTAVVDVSGRDWIHQCYHDPGIHQLEKNQFNVHGITYFDNARSIPRLREQYDYLVLDYGPFGEIADVVSFTEKDVHVLVCGYKPSEKLHLHPVFDIDSGTVQYLFSFVSEKMQKTVSESMLEYAGNTYFAGYSPDVWHYCGNDRLYQALTRAGGRSQRAAKKRGLAALFGSAAY